MRLLIVSDTLAGGMGALARAHASWFAAHDWDVSFAAPSDGAPPVAPVRYLEVPAVSSLRRAGEAWRARAALRSLPSADVVHAHGMRSFVLCRLAGLQRPYVSVHGSHPAGDDPWGYDTMRRAWFALLPRLARGATSGEPTDAKGWTYHPFASPLLAQVGQLPFPSADSAPTIAWLGLLDDRKQPEMFVHAIARFAAGGNAVRGLLGGTGPRFDRIKALVDELGAPVEMLGHADPVAVLSEAWALALFSRSEGTPLAVMEAMWTGRSVVASPLPGNAHLVGDTGALVDGVDEAVAALRSLVTDHDLARRRGEQAAARIRTLLTPDTPWADLERSYRT